MLPTLQHRTYLSDILKSISNSTEHTSSLLTAWHFETGPTRSPGKSVTKHQPRPHKIPQASRAHPVSITKGHSVNALFQFSATNHMRIAFFSDVTQRTLIIPYRRFGINYPSHLFDLRSVKKTGPIGCPETSVRNYHCLVSQNSTDFSLFMLLWYYLLFNVKMVREEYNVWAQRRYAGC